MSEWKQYRKTATQEMRPYVPGEDLSGISVSEEDTSEEGGMIARNAKNHDDHWYVAKQFALDNYELVANRLKGCCASKGRSTKRFRFNIVAAQTFRSTDEINRTDDMVRVSLDMTRNEWSRMKKHLLRIRGITPGEP